MPEKFIWRVGIALHCLPRILLFPAVIHKHYKNTQLGRRYNLTTWWFGPLNFLSCISQVVENGALMTLTYVSSTDNFGKIFCESCLVMMGIMDCQSIPLINTHIWKLDWCSILILINTPLTLAWSTICWLAKCQLTLMHQYKTSSMTTNRQWKCWWSVDRVSSEILMDSQLSINGVSIKSIDWQCQLTRDSWCLLYTWSYFGRMFKGCFFKYYWAERQVWCVIS